MKFHHYHHLGAETMLFLQIIGLPEINVRLKRIEEQSKNMAQNQDELKQTLEEIQAEQAASAQRWEVRNSAQQQTITDLKELVKRLEEQNANSDVELEDELALAKQILKTEQETFATATETSTEETTEDSSEESEEAAA